MSNTFDPEADRSALRKLCSGDELPFPEACLHELFEQRVESAPDAVFLRCSEQLLTFDEVNRRANQLARELRRLGLARQAVVALHLHGRPEFPIAIFAVLKAGCTYLPIDPSMPAERVAYMMRDARAELILTLEEQRPKLDGDWRVLALDEKEVLDRIGQHASEDLAVDCSPRDVAYVIYTSGSTGRPKGVAVEHRSVVSLVHYTRRLLGIDSSTRILQFSSPSFDVCVREVYEAALFGGQLCLARREDMLPGKPLVATLEAHEVTLATLPPSVLSHCPPSVLPHLRVLVVGGEACTTSVVRRWKPGRTLWNAYGPTETTVASSIGECIDLDRRPDIGRPVANTQFYIVDGDLQPCAIGQEGELLIGGVGLAHGYVGRPRLTAARFIPDPFGTEPGGRLYRTGDRAMWRADGTVEYLGRIDDQIKLRGFRIEPGEIEHVLSETAHVSAAAVVCIGEGTTRRLVAYVVPSAGSTFDLQRIRERLAEKLPAYMIPSEIVALESLPITANGKVDKSALPAPDGDVETASRADSERFSPLEQRMRQIWTGILQVDAIGRSSDFFAIGGSSLVMALLVLRIEEEFGVTLSAAQIEASRTIESLCKVVETEIAAMTDDGQRGAAASGDL